MQDPGDQEYVAFALQLASLAEDDREVWLDAYPGTARPRPREVNALVAAADPLRFGARAWRYFASPGNGCTSVRAIIAGERTFSLGQF